MATNPIKFSIIAIDKSENTITAVGEVNHKETGAAVCARYPDKSSHLLASWCGEPILERGSDRLVGVSIQKGNESHLLIRIRPHDLKMVNRAKVGATFTLDGVANDG